MKNNDSRYFVRKVIESKFKNNCTYNLVLETFLNTNYLTVNIEKGDEVIRTINSSEDKDDMIKLGIVLFQSI